LTVYFVIRTKNESPLMITEVEYNKAVRDYTKNVFRFVFKNLRDKGASEDIVQDTYLKLWINRTTVDSLKVKSWLFSVAHNALINYSKLQTRKTGLDNLEAENKSIEATINFDVKEIIERGLNELPALQKSIVLLRDLEGYNYKEIGDILNLNESQVKVYLFRARQKVKDSFKTLSGVI
jgi:RNA polymerase sigma factor (sigma-70 family)